METFLNPFLGETKKVIKVLIFKKERKNLIDFLAMYFLNFVNKPLYSTCKNYCTRLFFYTLLHKRQWFRDTV